MKAHKRIGVFALVGLANTIFDYLIFMFVSSFFSNELASIISATFAMIVSFFLHQRFTWRDRATSRSTIIQFLVVTAFVMWGLRTLVVWALTAFSTGWMAPFYGFAHWVLRFLPYETVVKTGIFAIATLVTLTVNYILYNKVIFRHGKQDQVD